MSFINVNMAARKWIEIEENNFIDQKLTWTAILLGAAVEKVDAEVYCWAAAAVETVDAGGNCCGRVLSR